MMNSELIDSGPPNKKPKIGNVGGSLMNGGVSGGVSGGGIVTLSTQMSESTGKH
jgi:hypothetical protein